MKFLTAVRFVFALGGVMSGLWLATMGILWAIHGITPATFGPSIVIGGGLWFIVLAIDSAIRADRDVRAEDKTAEAEHQAVPEKSR